jgi:GT2 family glycosyltransferase
LRAVPHTDDGILVVLPTLGDRLDFLRETLESVDAQRADVDLTLVVVAPSTAKSARSLAREFGAVVIDDPRAGISAAINRGLTARTTERYYAWIGDDDLFRPGGLARLRAALEARTDAVVAFGGCDYVDPEGRVLWVSAAGRLATFLLPWGPDLIPNPAAMIRFDALLAIGGFDEELRFAMDLDAFLKLRAHGRFIALRTPVAAFRWHPDSLTVSNRRRSSAESEAVKHRQLPQYLRPLAPLWDLPVRWASAVAASRLTARAHRARGVRPGAS